MKWITVSHLSEERFQRLTGVKCSSFDKMLLIVDEAKPIGGRGRPSKLCNADKILMMLMYYQEYRPFFTSVLLTASGNRKLAGSSVQFRNYSSKISYCIYQERRNYVGTVKPMKW